MIIQNYTESERAMLLALVSSPVFKLLQKVIDEDRQECLKQLATERDIGNIRELQGRILGCNALENVPRLIGRYELAEEAKRKAQKKTKIAKP